MSYAPRVSDIDLADLCRRGIGGIIVDLDNTLVGYRKLVPDDRDAGWIVAAREHGLRVVMVTNNATPWARDVARKLAIPCIPNARKPFPYAFRRALGLLELGCAEVVVVGDQFFTDVLGARFAGLAAILVEPIVAHDPYHVRPLRMVEKWLLRGLPRV